MEILVSGASSCPPRIWVAGFFHETHSFVTHSTTRQDFSVLRGDELGSTRGDGSPLDGFWEVADRCGWDVHPLLDLRAFPGGPVEKGFFGWFWELWEEEARKSPFPEPDAIFLILHGAMVCQDVEDPEGCLLSSLRRKFGNKVRLFAVLDLHANVSGEMIRAADALVAYRENPHTDARQTAVRAAQLLDTALREDLALVVNACRLPVLHTPSATGTRDEPWSSLRAEADELEREQKAPVVINITPGFAYADVPEAGTVFSVVSTPETWQGIKSSLGRLAGTAWKLRDLSQTTLPDAGKVVQSLAMSASNGTAVVAEPSDNIGAGAPGDCTGLLRAYLCQPCFKALFVLCDPPAVQALQAIPSGGTMTLSIGGRGFAGDQGPVRLELTLVSLSDGAFLLEDRNSHLASMIGHHASMGPSAVVTALQGNLTLLLTSKALPPFDLGQLRSQGLEPSSFRCIGVKAAVAHRRAYDVIAQENFSVATPGPCDHDLRTLPYQKVSRPVYPLDAMTDEFRWENWIIEGIRG